MVVLWDGYDTVNSGWYATVDFLQSERRYRRGHPQLKTLMKPARLQSSSSRRGSRGRGILRGLAATPTPGPHLREVGGECQDSGIAP